MARTGKPQPVVAGKQTRVDSARIFGIALRLTLGIAFILRLWRVGAKSLWLDEAMSVSNASRPFLAMIEHLKGFDAHPPLYQAVQWLWLQIGAGDGFVRLPSVIAGVIGVWLTWLIARRLFGRTAALVAALLMAISCFNIYYSQEARLNALVTTLVLAQVYIMIRILDRRGKASWKWWTACGLVALASLYTYVLCILTIGALAVVYLWLNRRDRHQWTEFIIVHLVVALLFLPWVPILRRTTQRVNESILLFQDAAGRPGIVQLTNGFAAWGSGPHEFDPDGLLGAGLGVALVVIGAVAVTRRRTRRPARILGALFLLPLAAYLIMPMPRVQAYDPKHLIFLQPLLLIALAGARTPVWRCKTQRGLLPLFYITAAVLLLNVFALSRYYPKDVQKEDWRGLFDDVASRLTATDAIVFNPGYVGFAMGYYAGTDEAQAGIKELNKRGILTLQGAEVRPAVERIWLIECYSPVTKPDEDIPRIIKQRNWEPVEEQDYQGLMGVKVKAADPQTGQIHDLHRSLSWTLYKHPASSTPGEAAP